MNIEAQLVIHAGSPHTPDTTFLLASDATSIGRASEGHTPDISFDDPRMSRRHAEIRREREGFVIVDLGSTNGTEVNGRRLEAGHPHVLQDGDLLNLAKGAAVLRFKESSACMIHSPEEYEAVLHYGSDPESVEDLRRRQDRIRRQLRDNDRGVKCLDSGYETLSDRDLEDAMCLLQDAYGESGDRDGVQRPFVSEKPTLPDREGRNAIRLLQQAEILYRHSGNMAGVRKSLNRQALIHSKHGNKVSALHRLREVEFICREMGDNVGLQTCLSHQAPIKELIAVSDLWHGAKEPVSASGSDQIDCTIFSPPQVPRGTMFMVQAFVHLATQREEAEALAKEFDEDGKRRGYRSLSSRVARGSVLAFHLVMRGLEIEDEVQETVWQGEPTSVQFGVSVPDNCRSEQVIGTVTVSQDTVPIGQVKFRVTVTTANRAEQRSPESTGEASRFNRSPGRFPAACRARVV